MTDTKKRSVHLPEFKAKVGLEVKWSPKTGQQFKWDTVTKNGVNHDRYKKAQRSPAGVQVRILIDRDHPFQ